MKDLKTLNSYRLKKSEEAILNNSHIEYDKSIFGIFQISLKAGVMAKVIADNGLNEPEWEHVSVSLPNRCLTWEEMCKIKDIFFYPDEAVVQFHPPKDEYVNIHPYCLHLWKYKGDFPRPKPTSVI